MYVLFLQLVGSRPLPNAVYRGLSVHGPDRTALMAAPHEEEEVVGKPYEAKSDVQMVKSSLGGAAPEEQHLLFLSNSTARRVYPDEKQQRHAIRLLMASPVQAWARVARDAWNRYENSGLRTIGMQRGVIDRFVRGMFTCLPKGEPMALITFCGSALREVALRHLDADMLVESDLRYGCFHLICDSRFVAG